jgi:hypothetical protein
MAVDPDSLSERQRTVSPNELEMQDSESLEDVADVSDDLLEKLD